MKAFSGAGDPSGSRRERKRSASERGLGTSLPTYVRVGQDYAFGGRTVCRYEGHHIAGGKKKCEYTHVFLICHVTFLYTANICVCLFIIHINKRSDIYFKIFYTYYMYQCFCVILRES